MKPWISRLMVIGSLSTFSACGGGSGAGTNILTPSSPPPTPNQWTWVSGSNLANQPGIYGSLGTPASSNVPGTRWAAVGWTDARGNLWFFGGNGYGSAGTDDILNDLWEYSASEWIWRGGSNQSNQLSVYGTEGVAASSNDPGGRFPGCSWTDSSGNFWLFGGLGGKTRLEEPLGSTTYGSTAVASGLGWADRICQTSQACTESREWLPPVMFQARGSLALV